MIELGGIRRLEALQAITDAALAHLTLDNLLDELLDRIRALLHVDTAAILMFDEQRGQLVARAAKGLEEEVERGVTIPVGRGFAGRIAAERRPLAIDDVDHADILNPLLREKGVRSLLGVPLVVNARVIGVLHIGTLVERRFTASDEELLQAVGDRAALAIEHARAFEAERRARHEAEQTAARLERLQVVTEASLAHLGLDRLLAELLGRIDSL
ncbi:MAG: GAF domain-containing protein, partial [Actinomycetota bacterium]|nr:GAF domain-containing protein [Actinomycetota bacterium]